MVQVLGGTNVAASTAEREGYMRAWLSAFVEGLGAAPPLHDLARLLSW